MLGAVVGRPRRENEEIGLGVALRSFGFCAFCSCLSFGRRGGGAPRAAEAKGRGEDAGFAGQTLTGARRRDGRGWLERRAREKTEDLSRAVAASLAEPAPAYNAEWAAEGFRPEHVGGAMQRVRGHGAGRVSGGSKPRARAQEARAPGEGGPGSRQDDGEHPGKEPLPKVFAAMASYERITSFPSRGSKTVRASIKNADPATGTAQASPEPSS